MTQPQSAPRAQPTIRTAVVTMNNHEAAALTNALHQAMWHEGKKSHDGLGRVGYAISDWQSPTRDVDLEHVNLDNSGNLLAAALTTKHFNSKTKYDAILMFGCAGRNTAHKDHSQFPLGSVVLVDEALYAENGRVYQEAFPMPGQAVERVSIKGDRFKTFSAEPSSLLTHHLARLLGLPMVKALCVDKVLQIDPATPTPMPGPPAQEYGYTDLIRQGKQHIIDMESFGFMWALGDLARNAAVIRVLTDDLSTHSASTGGTGQAPDQRTLLFENAPIVLDAILGHPLLSPVVPPVVPPATDGILAVDRLSSSVNALADAIQLASQASETPSSAVAQFMRWLTAAQPDLITSPASDDEARAAHWFRDVAFSAQLGYGSKSVSMETRAIHSTAMSLINRQQSKAALDPDIPYAANSHEFFGRLSDELDPSRGKGSYERALRSLLRSQGMTHQLSVVTRSTWDGPIATLRARTSNVTDLLAHATSEPLSDHALRASAVVQWRGWEDDDLLLSEIRALFNLG